MSRTGHRSRRTARWAAALVLLVVVAASASATSATAEEPSRDVLRSGGEVLGTVSTQVISVVPLVGDLPLPVKVGTAGAQVDGEVRRASSHTADLGLLGTLGIVAITGAPTLTRLGIPVSQFTGAFKLPPATIADSRTKTDSETRPVFPAIPVGPVTVGGGHQEAHAADGKAIARTELGDATLDLGLITVELNGGVAETTADRTHIAATSTVGEMRFLTAGIEIGALRGLVWRFDQVLDLPPTSSFAIGSGRMGSMEFPIAAAPVADVTAALTRVLAPLGVSLTLPQLRSDGGLTPLRIALDDSPAAGMLARPVYSTLLADAVNQAEAAVVAGVPESGLALTVANVVLAATTGQGGLAVELGGITGVIGRRPVEQFTYVGVAAPALPTLPTVVAPAGGLDSSRPTPMPAIPPTTPAAPPATSAPLASRLASVVTGEDLPAVLVVLAGLSAAIGLAAIDRRRIAALIAQMGGP